MEEREVVVIGAGPAGLSAALEAARAGAHVLLVDENSKPGGQLFKQIHKFFGSHEHRAGVRGIDIGTQLLEEAERLDIEVWLDAEACGIFNTTDVWIVRNKEKSVTVRAKRIILATGAVENSVNFPGWSLPGVMGAGAAQTMINLHRVLPGQKILMVGSGNVGIIVSYQLLQAGADVKAVVEAAPRLGGYGVHTAKVRRAGVPFYTSHTVLEARGTDHVESATIVQLDDKWKPIPGTEKELDVDTICIAAGLTPLVELAFAAGCEPLYSPLLGGMVPWHDRSMATSIPTIYLAGDISGVEEASTAMEEGRMAGLSAAYSLGYVDRETYAVGFDAAEKRMLALRSGMFGQKRRDAKAAIVGHSRG
ncbi:MAG: NAD(P)/FAD-dependent oxidoreductase [Sphaerochaetaceae bacterium]|jgi:thioredoxin reductase|nr:NAD(P)/FAD-dependent oxidoreductase [Sphaerochaetaceae bacterium]MDD3942427.1 NAD(P)/FAD-dependent oxidoreductase [Sphaerochaetaceae bacterium]MDX9938668.1 NAD(P)/FAD-dependent oxidoreductase [Sphaerochaetaceae bacterium]